jgi:hypothetical protein
MIHVIKNKKSGTYKEYEKKVIPDFIPVRPLKIRTG